MESRKYLPFDDRLESSGLWSDFHHTFIPSLRERIGRLLGPGYIALVEERVYATWGNPPQHRSYRPDLSVASTDPNPRGIDEVRETPGATVEPVLVPLALREEVTEPSVSIRTRKGELVTCLELLSPSNKRAGDEGRTSYLAKRHDLLTSGIHLVEIDLLLEGERMPLAAAWPNCDRSVLVVRRFSAHAGELYPFFRRDRLPTVRVPLRSPDPDVPLDLQEVFEEAWQRADYGKILSTAE